MSVDPNYPQLTVTTNPLSGKMVVNGGIDLDDSYDRHTAPIPAPPRNYPDPLHTTLRGEFVSDIIEFAKSHPENLLAGVVPDDVIVHTISLQGDIAQSAIFGIVPPAVFLHAENVLPGDLPNGVTADPGSVRNGPLNPGTTINNINMVNNTYTNILLPAPNVNTGDLQTGVTLDPGSVRGGALNPTTTINNTNVTNGTYTNVYINTTNINNGALPALPGQTVTIAPANVTNAVYTTVLVPPSNIQPGPLPSAPGTEVTISASQITAGTLPGTVIIPASSIPAQPGGPVIVATTANIPLTGTFAVDGRVLVAGDTVLVKNQTTTTENGIWTVAAGPWTRSSAMDPRAYPGSVTDVLAGTTNGGTSWALDGTPDATGLAVGTAPLTFTKLGPAAGITYDVVAVATTNIAALTGIPLPIDSVTIAAGDAILLTAQLTQTNNGIWIVASGAWTRSPAMPTGSNVYLGTKVHVLTGDRYGGSNWVTVRRVVCIVGTNSLRFNITNDPRSTIYAKPSGSYSYTAGTNLVTSWPNRDLETAPDANGWSCNWVLNSDANNCTPNGLVIPTSVSRRTIRVTVSFNLVINPPADANIPIVNAGAYWEWHGSFPPITLSVRVGLTLDGNLISDEGFEMLPYRSYRNGVNSYDYTFPTRTQCTFNRVYRYPNAGGVIGFGLYGLTIVSSNGYTPIPNVEDLEMTIETI